MTDPNSSVIERFQNSRPRLTGVVRAGDVLPQLGAVSVLHAGPPITAAAMGGPMRGAIVGALVYEGLSRSAAEEAMQSTELHMIPTNAVGVVAPLAGIVTRSMPLWCVEDATYGNRAYANFNEGLGKVLRFGANDDEVIGRLRWLENVLAPIMQKVINRSGPLDLKEFFAEALRRGDECHNRNKSGTSSFVREYAQYIVGVAPDEAAEVFAFLRGNDHFCLNLSIAGSKCSADAAQAADTGSIVTSMASNGRDFGIRVSGLGDDWITAPAGRAEGDFFKGFTEADASPDLGDSYISEVVGLGGFSMAAAPAIAAFVGGVPSEYAKWTQEMYKITWAEHEQYRIPSLDFRGAPLGIDVFRVVETGQLPVMNSGIAHKDPGCGQIGAGLAKPPMECFRKAVDALTGSRQWQS